MLPFYLLLGFCLIAMSGSAVFAMFWAGRNQQFSNLKEAAHVIFDQDEVPGALTDVFPGEEAKAKAWRNADV
jgi:cbb3-type cytochrome oxidase maturation protein